MPVHSPLMKRITSDDERGRHLVASTRINKGELIFCERPMVALQSTGNVHEGVLVCHYCMSFCGRPEHTLQVASDPTCLPAITATAQKDDNDSDDGYALVPCRNGCGQVYCSRECRDDDWEFGGHEELCTGRIADADGIEDHPLLQFKTHAIQTNEIFLLIGQWIARIHKQNIPYHDDDRQNTHPYTDFMMNPWWDVATLPLKNDPSRLEEATSLEETLKRLCEESHGYLQEAWTKDFGDNVKDSKWLTPLGMARLIGSLEQNCVGVRRKHPIRRNVMEDVDFRHTYHEYILKCLERAGMIGGEEEEDDDDDENDDDDEDADKSDDDVNDENHRHSGCGDACDEENCCGGDKGSEGVNRDGNNKSNNQSADEGDSEVDTNVNSSGDGNGNVDVSTGQRNDSLDNNPVQSDDAVGDYSFGEIAEFLANIPTPLNIGSDDEWDNIFIPLDGTAHFSTISKMNHSCEPNTVVLYKSRGWGKDHPLVAYCVAVRDISPHEELTISYIVSDDDYDNRQAALQNYGFVCTCPKCQREKNMVNDNNNNNNNNNTDDEKETPTTCISVDDESDALFGDDDDDDEEPKQDDANQGDDLYDLFGDDDDDDDDNESLNDAGNNNDKHQQEEVDDENNNNDNDDIDGDTKLLKVAEQLESFLNKSNQATIPLKYLAPVSNYILQLAMTILKEMNTENNNAATNNDRNNQMTTISSNGSTTTIIHSLVTNCHLAVQERDFAMCRIVGCDLESYLYRQLRTKQSWPNVSYRYSYWIAGLVTAIGHAHDGNFLIAMKYIDKVLILGQPRTGSSSTNIDGFISYVELHASEMAAGPCPPAVHCEVVDILKEVNKEAEKTPETEKEEEEKEDDDDDILQTLHSIGLSKPITFPVEEISSKMGSDKKNNDVGNVDVDNDDDDSNFLETMIQSRSEPIVIRNLASNWPATRKWKHLHHLVQRYGHRLVPIEIGSIKTTTRTTTTTASSTSTSMSTNTSKSSSSSSNNNQMKEELMTFRTFVSDYLAPSTGKNTRDKSYCWSLQDATQEERTTKVTKNEPLNTGQEEEEDDDDHNTNNKRRRQIAYLAQHPMLDQIPELYHDVQTNPCNVRPTNVNIWLGTGGTRTPLHFDSYDNLLIQIVGAKYVRVYHPNCTSKLYVHRSTTNDKVMTSSSSTRTTTTVSGATKKKPRQEEQEQYDDDDDDDDNTNDNDNGVMAQGNISQVNCEMEDYTIHPLCLDCTYVEVLLLPGDCLFIPAHYWHYVRSLTTSISINYWF